MQPGASNADTHARAPGGAAPAGAAPAGAAPPIDAARLRMAVSRLARTIRRQNLAGLTPTKLSALATVEKTGPVRLSDLAAAEGIAPSTLTRLVASLEDDGYVERGTVPGDARASTLSITPQGTAVIDRIRKESTRMLAGMLAQLTAGQQAAIATALPALEQLSGPEGTGS